MHYNNNIKFSNKIAILLFGINIEWKPIKTLKTYNNYV